MLDVPLGGGVGGGRGGKCRGGRGEGSEGGGGGGVPGIHGQKSDIAHSVLLHLTFAMSNAL